MRVGASIGVRWRGSEQMLADVPRIGLGWTLGNAQLTLIQTAEAEFSVESSSLPVSPIRCEKVIINAKTDSEAQHPPPPSKLDRLTHVASGRIPRLLDGFIDDAVYLLDHRGRRIRARRGLGDVSEELKSVLTSLLCDVRDPRRDWRDRTRLDLELIAERTPAKPFFVQLWVVCDVSVRASRKRVEAAGLVPVGRIGRERAGMHGCEANPLQAEPLLTVRGRPWHSSGLEIHAGQIQIQSHIRVAATPQASHGWEPPKREAMQPQVGRTQIRFSKSPVGDERGDGIGVIGVVCTYQVPQPRAKPLMRAVLDRRPTRRRLVKRTSAVPQGSCRRSSLRTLPDRPAVPQVEVIFPKIALWMEDLNMRAVVRISDKRPARPLRLIAPSTGRSQVGTEVAATIRPCKHMVPLDKGVKRATAPRTAVPKAHQIEVLVETACHRGCQR